ncbi:hypothetical protein [Aneurinibacillus migulanus]|uniref:hypothetical protein n=1 Tax=Aneurinibacillus migulanus TaxID=47500 RepID=UPI001F29D913|nr:hypothetical protein [Aneurinibacillus migulanus]
MINRQTFVVRGKKRRKNGRGRKKTRLPFFAGAQGVSTLFFPHPSSFQPRYPVKILGVTYINWGTANISKSKLKNKNSLFKGCYRVMTNSLFFRVDCCKT